MLNYYQTFSIWTNIARQASLFPTIRQKIPLSGYPTYHSVYETFHLVEIYYDPEFKYHLAGAHLFGELLRDFADSVLLPMDCVSYAAAVQEYVENFRNGSSGLRILKEGLSLGMYRFWIRDTYSLPILNERSDLCAHAKATNNPSSFILNN